MSDYPEGMTPKMIALHTRINVNTIKSILPKIQGIKKIMRGLYKVVNGGDGTPKSDESRLTSWNFHNLHLSCILDFKPSQLIERTHSFGLLNFKFIISKKGRCTFSLASDYPLNISAINMVGEYFSTVLLVSYNASVTLKDIQISTIEFNRDYSNLRLDGVQCISLDSLNEQFKTYQKRIGLRIEHKTKVKFSSQDVVDMLTNNLNTTDIHTKLNQTLEGNALIMQKLALLFDFLKNKEGK